jgi:hypothetical protein
MNWLEAVSWDLLGVALPTALGAGILFGWLCRRMKRRLAAPAEPGSVSPVFAQEMHLQTLRQQAEQALRNILAVVEAERGRLQPVLAAAASSGAVPKKDAPDAFRWDASEDNGNRARRYEGLETLAKKGLTLRQIADRTSLPVGEVELVLKLRGGGFPTHSVEAIRQ